MVSEAPAADNGIRSSPGHLRTQGARAVTGMWSDCNQIGDIMSEIAAYRTAVTAGPVVAMTPGTIPDPYAGWGRHAWRRRTPRHAFQRPRPRAAVMPK